MPDIVIPNTLNFARARFRLIENVGVSRALYTGRTRTSELGGDRVGCSLEAAPSMAAQRAALKSFAMQAGRRNRVYLYDPGYRPRGSFPATELLTNADFSQGLANWAPLGSFIVSNGSSRITLTAGGQQALISATPGPSLVAHAPYAARTFFSSLSDPTAQCGPYFQDGGSIVYNFAYTTGPGLKTVHGVTGTGGTGAFAAYADVRTSGSVAGQSANIGFLSLARCLLADGRQNLLLSSQTPGTNTGWVLSEATAGLNGTPAPDATGTAWFLSETTATASHTAAQTVSVAAGPADFTFSLYVNFAGTLRNRCYLYMQENTSGTAVIGWFSNSTGFTSSTVGANWANFRQTVTNVGNGWIRISITARKTNAATSITVIYGPTTADGVTGYAGTTTPVAMLSWGASLAASSVPVRLTATTTTASTGTAQSGYGIHVKGLPAGTAGLLLAGDWVEIITSQGSELKMLTADLDSDAAGLGFLQFAPALRGPVADNAPIIVHRPMGRFISTADSIEYQDEPGIITTSSFDFEEG